MDFLANNLNHRQSKHSQFWLCKCFLFQQKYFTIGVRSCNGLSPELYISFDIQVETLYLTLCSPASLFACFTSNILNIGW